MLLKDCKIGQKVTVTKILDDTGKPFKLKEGDILGDYLGKTGKIVFIDTSLAYPIQISFPGPVNEYFRPRELKIAKPRVYTYKQLIRKMNV